MDNESLKLRAVPKNKELIEKIESLIVLTDELKAESEAQTKILDRLCTLKEEFQTEWFKVSEKKFRLSMIAAFLTCALLYLDVLKLDEQSKIVPLLVDAGRMIVSIL